MKKLIAEVIGTATLVLMGCGAAVLAGAGTAGVEAVGQLGIAFVFGLAIGMTLVLIHIVGIQVTGVSVNPARSFGPAVFVQGSALTQLWLFIVAPLIGAGLAGLLFKFKVIELSSLDVA